MPELLKFYNEQIFPFWKRHSEIKNQSAQNAAQLFFDLMKIIISLSTGMLAFIAAISYGIELRYLVKFIVLFVSAIISAIFAFVNSAREYKKASDEEGELLHKVAKAYVNGQIPEVQNLIKNTEERPLEKGYNEWHKLSIGCGCISIGTFLLGVIWFIITLPNFIK